MTFADDHKERIVRLLKHDAERRNYTREYMKEYLRKKKEETGVAQKQYSNKDDTKKRAKEVYQQKTVLSDLKYLFQ